MFIVEPKYGKGFIEPDVFTIWKGAPMWIEIQRTFLSDKAVNEKVNRYEDYYNSSKWVDELWQPKNRNPIFPSVVFVTPHRFNFDSILRFVQVGNIGELVNQQPKNESRGISVVLK